MPVSNPTINKMKYSGVVGVISTKSSTSAILAGAKVPCVGSALLENQAIQNENYEVLTRKAEDLVEAGKEGQKSD